MDDPQKPSLAANLAEQLAPLLPSATASPAPAVSIHLAAGAQLVLVLGRGHHDRAPASAPSTGRPS